MPIAGNETLCEDRAAKTPGEKALDKNGLGKPGQEGAIKWN